MKGIGFKNMKVFKENQWFDFKDITLLTGTNNSGKSSIINAMQMLQENIKAKNIDELLRTDFKLKANQTKYGSIANFVNNESTKPEDNYFVYVRQIDNIEYRIKIDINSGLESYGSIHVISALDAKTKYLGVDKRKLHNDQVYDISLLNIIERLSGTEAQLRPADFAYLKDCLLYTSDAADE